MEERERIKNSLKKKMEERERIRNSLSANYHDRDSEFSTQHPNSAKSV